MPRNSCTLAPTGLSASTCQGHGVQPVSGHHSPPAPESGSSLARPPARPSSPARPPPPLEKSRRWTKFMLREQDRVVGTGPQRPSRSSREGRSPVRPTRPAGRPLSARARSARQGPRPGSVSEDEDGGSPVHGTPHPSFGPPQLSYSLSLFFYSKKRPEISGRRNAFLFRHHRQGRGGVLESATGLRGLCFSDGESGRIILLVGRYVRITPISMDQPPIKRP